MRREKDDIDRVLHAILDQVMEAASKDHMITELEQKIIDRVKQAITTMQSQLYEILNSDLSEEEFQEIANEIIHNKLENTINLEELSKASPREKELIACLRRIIEEGI